MTEALKGCLQPENFTFLWKIERFFADCQKVGDYYRSPMFPIQYPNQITKWYLYAYPKGENQESKDFVSLFLWYFSESKTKVTLDLQVSIVNEQCPKYKGTATFKGQTFGYGWRQFRKHDFIKDVRNGVLIEDTLTILCEVKFHPTAQDIPKSVHHCNEWPEKIGHGLVDYEKLYENGHFTDVTFNVQDKKINTHKAILSYRSPVFKNMFEHANKEQEHSAIDVTDIDYNVMEELFRFIYSGKVRNIERIASKLLIAADKYQVIELKTLCEKALYDNVTVDNAIEILKLTDACNTVHLKRLVIKFAADHYKDVVKKPEFTDLDKIVMHQIILTVAEKD